MTKRTSRQSVSVLADRMDKIENRLIDISMKIANTTQTSITFWNKISKDIRIAYDEARVVFSMWNESEIPYFYKENLRNQIKRIKGMKSTIKKVSYFDMLKKDATKQSISAIMRSSIADFTIGSLAGEKKMMRLVSSTQQLLLAESRLDKIVQEGQTVNQSTYKVQKNIQAQLLSDAIDGKYIQIVNKNGVINNWNLEAYSKMVARTKITESQTSSTVNLAAEYETDLVQVSSHNTLTAYDAQFEGKIFSLTGRDKNFPVATDLPPFHPNCRHSITVVFKEGLEANGTLKELSEFSKGEIDAPPRKKSFIPLKDRKLVGAA